MIKISDVKVSDKLRAYIEHEFDLMLKAIPKTDLDRDKLKSEIDTRYIKI